MDIRGFFNGGKKEKSKRPDEGASARPPAPKRKFQHTTCVMLDWFKHGKPKSSQ